MNLLGFESSFLFNVEKYYLIFIYQNVFERHKILTTFINFKVLINSNVYVYTYIFIGIIFQVLWANKITLLDHVGNIYLAL